jgi:membrane protease subunit HflC
VTLIRAEAKKQAQVLSGEGEAESTKIYADAYSQDADFFNFYRSLQAYRDAFGADGTTMVLSPDSEFLKYMSNHKGLVGAKPGGQ